VKIERVQYDGEGQWLDVVFDDGKKTRFAAALIRNLAEISGWDASPCEAPEKEKP
jgi:hypothetical protein